MAKTTYIMQASTEVIVDIIEQLVAVGITDCAEALAGRLCDLEDTIDIDRYLKGA